MSVLLFFRDIILESSFSYVKLCKCSDEIYCVLHVGVWCFINSQIYRTKYKYPVHVFCIILYNTPSFLIYNHYWTNFYYWNNTINIKRAVKYKWLYIAIILISKWRPLHINLTKVKPLLHYCIVLQVFFIKI